MTNPAVSIYHKINAVMQSVQYLQKDTAIAFKSTRYKALSEEKVTTTIRKHLIEQRLVFYPHKQEWEKQGSIFILSVTYRLVDSDTGDFIEVVSTGEGMDSGDKGVGKASTYAYKYALLRLFAIPSGDDPDDISSDELNDQVNKLNQKRISLYDMLSNIATSPEVILQIEGGLRGEWQQNRGQQPQQGMLKLDNFNSWTPDEIEVASQHFQIA